MKILLEAFVPPGPTVYCEWVHVNFMLFWTVQRLEIRPNGQKWSLAIGLEPTRALIEVGPME